jgi:CubicO group peptidase (beta-lactamase class C family)
MDGSWLTIDNNSVYFSTTRSMARFGLLMLNNGKWDNNSVINENYCKAATTTSQNINKSFWTIYGGSMVKQVTIYHNRNRSSLSLIPAGPTDMYMVLGKMTRKFM